MYAHNYLTGYSSESRGSRVDFRVSNTVRVSPAGTMITATDIAANRVPTLVYERISCYGFYFSCLRWSMIWNVNLKEQTSVMML